MTDEEEQRLRPSSDTDERKTRVDRLKLCGRLGLSVTLWSMLT